MCATLPCQTNFCEICNRFREIGNNGASQSSCEKRRQIRGADLLGVVFERGAFEVSDYVRGGVLQELNFVGDGTTFVDGGCGFGLAVAVTIDGSSSAMCRIFSVEALNFLSGFGDVLDRVNL